MADLSKNEKNLIEVLNYVIKNYGISKARLFEQFILYMTENMNKASFKIYDGTIIKTNVKKDLMYIVKRSETIQFYMLISPLKTQAIRHKQAIQNFTKLKYTELALKSV